MNTETILLFASIFIIPALTVAYIKRNETRNYTQPIQEGVRLPSTSNYENLPTARPIADANAYIYTAPYRGGKTKQKRQPRKQTRRKK